MSLWQTHEQRFELLKQLVALPSVTNSEGELQFPYHIKELLLQLPYFKNNENHIRLIKADGKHALTALYRSDDAKQTIVLISHFDTVGTDDYGMQQSIACHPDNLTAYFEQASLTADIKADILSGQYLFGRGIMDMKAGLMIHMSIIERAAIEAWPVNLLLLTVPDEEVNSSGMRYAAADLADYAAEEGLDIALFLNGEPTFSQQPGDDQHYFYTGSIGKVLTGVYIYGKETHVGEPLKGFSSNYLLGQINRNIEYNPIFIERFKKEKTPLPVNLSMKDHKQHYDVQTPFISSAYYNLFLFERSAQDIYELFHQQTALSVSEVEHRLQHLYEDQLKIKVMTYSELIDFVAERHPESTIEQITHQSSGDYLNDCETIINQLLKLEPELAPIAVTYIAPPYYPAVNNSAHPQIKTIAKFSKQQLKQMGRPSKRIHYFNGISDLSYVSYKHDEGDAQTFKHNSPIADNHYFMPFDAMRNLSAPVLNIGPLGKDAHQKTERIHIKSAVEEIPALYKAIIHQFFID